MVKVDIYRNSKQKYDILVLDTEQYLSSIAFDYVVEYVRFHVSDLIADLWFWDYKEENIQPCLGYQGIAIQLTQYIHDKENAKKELLIVLDKALQHLND